MESNSFEGSRVVRNEVRELMDEKSFAVSNREAVEGQDNLMRFLCTLCVPGKIMITDVTI